MGDRKVDHNQNKFNIAIKENQTSALHRLFLDGYKPDKEMMSQAIKTSLENGNHPITTFLINYSHEKGWDTDFNLDFKINGFSPLYYAVSKQDVSLVKALLKCKIDIFHEQIDKGEDLDSPNLMTVAVNNIRHNIACDEILYDLIKAGADISTASTLPLVGTLVTLKDDAITLKSVIPELDTYHPIVLRDFILNQLDDKKYDEVCIEIVGNSAAYKINPELVKFILATEGNGIVAKAHEQIVDSILYFSDKNYETIEWLKFLTEHGLSLADVMKEAKEMEVITPAESKARQAGFETRQLMRENNLDGFGNFHYEPSFLIYKLQRVIIPQDKLNYSLSFLDSRVKKNELLGYTAILIAAGAKPSDYFRESFSEKYQIKDINHLDVKFFKYLAEQNQLKELKMMLEVGLRFKDDYSFNLLKEMKSFANDELLAIIEPIILREGKIRHAKNEYKNKHAKIPDWLKHQTQLCSKLLTAIGKGDEDKVIELVAQGADPNFGTIHEEHINSGGAIYNIAGICPSHFACITLPEDKAFKMFQLLQDLGANIHIINEWTQMKFSQDLKDLYKNSPDGRLCHAILKAELTTPDARKQRKEQKKYDLRIPEHLQFIQSSPEDQVVEEKKEIKKKLS